MFLKRTLASVLLSVGVLAGCQTVSTTAEVEGGYLALPTEAINETKGESFSFFYGFQVMRQADDEKVDSFNIRPSTTQHLELVGPLAPGKYYIGAYMPKIFKSGNNRYTYIPKWIPINVPFEVSEDGVTLMDTSFIITLTGDNGSTSTRGRFYRLTDELKAKTIAALNNKMDMNDWQLID